MQELSEIGRKEAGETKRFPILWMGVIENVFQMEGKECVENNNPFQSEESAFAWDRQLCLSPWQWTRRGLRQPREIHQGRRGSKKRNEVPQVTWLSEACTNSLWFCNARPLAGK